MGDTTASHIVTSSKLADIVVRAHDCFIGTTCEVVASIDGTVVVVVTEQLLSVDASQQLIASVGGTDRVVVTDNRFGPIAMVGTRRVELDTTIKSASQTIVTIRGVDTNGTIVRAVGRWSAGLVLGHVGGVAANGTIVGRGLDDQVITRLGAVEAITNGPVGESFDTRFRTSIDLIRITRLGPVGLIGKGAGKASSYSGCINNVDLDVGSSKAIS